MKGEYNPELKKKKKKGKKKKVNPQEKCVLHRHFPFNYTTGSSLSFLLRLLGWWERKSDKSVRKEDKIVILKNLFNPKEFEVPVMMDWVLFLLVTCVASLPCLPRLILPLSLTSGTTSNRNVRSLAQSRKS